MIKINKLEKPLTSLVNIKLPFIGNILERHNNYNNLIGELLCQAYSKEQIVQDMNYLMENYSVEVEEVI